MPSYVIATDTVLEIGKRYEGLQETPWAPPDNNQPFVVLKESTWEAFLDHIVENGGSEFWAAVMASKSTNFYEISTD